MQSKLARCFLVALLCSLPGFCDQWESLRQKANRGDADSQCLLGIVYADGLAVPQDDSEAMKWFGRAAEQGSACGQFRLGKNYANGKGVPKDGREAVKWYRLAAEQGDVTAMFNLGVMYGEGDGVPQDGAESYIWFSLAATEGHAEAPAARDRRAARLTLAALSAAQADARKRFERISANRAD